MSTRTKRNQSAPVTNSNCDKKTTKRVESSWILLAADTLLKNDDFSIITLPHPGHGGPTKFCLDDLHNKMYEIVTFDEPYRSWFIGETVKSDGSVLIVSPVNPTFLVLPRLKDQCMTRAIPLEDLLAEEGFERILDFVPDLSHVADVKGSKEIKAYKYNKEKTLSWLDRRVRQLSKVLRAKNIHVRSGAVSATFVASSAEGDQVDEEFFLKYAHGILSHYLPDDLSDALEKRFDFKPELVESLAKKRKSETGATQSSKKIKSEKDDIKENIVVSPTQVVTKPKPLTAKEKARQKAAGGTKTISSFFTKKN